jgi:hypothetical protein
VYRNDALWRERVLLLARYSNRARGDRAKRQDLRCQVSSIPALEGLIASKMSSYAKSNFLIRKRSIDSELQHAAAESFNDIWPF